MPAIHIDDDVMRELQNRAIRFGLVFSSPNRVLRRILDIDGRDQETEGVQTMYLGEGKAAYLPYSNDEETKGNQHMSPTSQRTQLRPPQVTRKRRVTGKRLLREHPHLPKNLRPYSDRDGIFYEWPREFPAILFDDHGYLVFKNERDMLSARRYLTAYEDTGKISVRNGISSMPNYESCNHSHAHSEYPTEEEYLP